MIVVARDAGMYRSANAISGVVQSLKYAREQSRKLGPPGVSRASKKRLRAQFRLTTYLLVGRQVETSTEQYRIVPDRT
jgi:hypothetical protein